MTALADNYDGIRIETRIAVVRPSPALAAVESADSTGGTLASSGSGPSFHGSPAVSLGSRSGRLDPPTRSVISRVTDTFEPCEQWRSRRLAVVELGVAVGADPFSAWRAVTNSCSWR